MQTMPMVKSYPSPLAYLQPNISTSSPNFDLQPLSIHQPMDKVIKLTSNIPSISSTIYTKNNQQIWYLNLKLYSLEDHVVLPPL